MVRYIALNDSKHPLILYHKIIKKSHNNSDAPVFAEHESIKGLTEGREHQLLIRVANLAAYT